MSEVEKEVEPSRGKEAPFSMAVFIVTFLIHVGVTLSLSGLRVFDGFLGHTSGTGPAGFLLWIWSPLSAAWSYFFSSTANDMPSILAFFWSVVVAFWVTGAVGRVGEEDDAAGE